tara:strand:+ start:142 stop:759 length:618 start_codon:yes stop_codon:yes gene_type:complete
MSKNGKKLLNENTIRRFMKLAEIDTLSDQFVGTLSEKYVGATEEPVVEEDTGYGRDDDPQFDMQDAAAEDMGAPEPPMPDEPPDPEAADADMEEEGGEVTITDEEAAALQSVLEKLLAAQGEAPAEAEAVPDDLDMAAEEAPEAMMEEEDEVTGIELEEDLDEGAMVAEITRRVTDRLMKESRNEDMAEQLAEKILVRLKSTSQK